LQAALKDCAAIILDEGFCLSEVFAERWSHVSLNQRYMRRQADAIKSCVRTIAIAAGHKSGHFQGNAKIEACKDFGITQRNWLREKKKMVPGVGVELTDEDCYRATYLILRKTKTEKNHKNTKVWYITGNANRLLLRK